MNQNALGWKFFLPFLFLFFLVSSYLSLSGYISNFDEGISTYGAVRVSQGDIPYRDFWTGYGPAQFYILASLFKIFGPSLFVERMWSQFVFILLLIVSYLILNKSCSRRAALVGVFTMALLLINFSHKAVATTNPMFPGILFCLTSCYFFLNFLSEGVKRDAVFSGLCVAATALFRPELALAVFFLQTTIAIIFFNLNLSKNVRAWFWYPSSVFVALIPILIFFFFHCNPKDLFSDFIAYPLDIYPKFRSIPFFLYLSMSGHVRPDRLFWGLPRVIICVFSIVVLITGMVSLTIQVVRLRIKNEIPVIWYGCILFIALELICLKYSTTRTDSFHLFPLLGTSTILLFLLFSAFPKMKYLRLWLASLVFLFCFSLSLNLNEEFKQIFSFKPNVFDIKLARGIPVNRGDYALQEAVKFIQQNVPRKEKIFVGSISHDRVVINDVLFYFLSERGSATKYYEFEPGITTTKEIQQKIIEDIKTAKVRYIVLRTNDWWSEPNGSRMSSGVYLLDQFIQSNFRVIKKMGTYIILCRIDFKSIV